ncbi:MAG: ABC transporter permease [Candidatus Bathyarchaeia archaeon]
MDRRKIVDLLREDPPRLRSELRQTWGVFWAQLKIFLSYKTWVITETLSTVASIAMYYFMGFQVKPGQLVSAGYGSSWLAFALVGVASTHYLWMCISRLSHTMQHEIQDGTFETIICSPIRLRSYLVGQSVRGFLVSGYFMIGALAVGTFLLGAPLVLNPGTILSSVALLLLLVSSHLGIGMAAAGIILVYKKGDPLTFLFAIFTEFFGGVLFPLQLLANYPVLWAIAKVMPYTYALEGLRKVLLSGATLLEAEVLSTVVLLVAYTSLLVPLGLFAFRRGYNRVRTEGSTASY